MKNVLRPVLFCFALLVSLYPDLAVETLSAQAAHSREHLPDVMARIPLTPPVYPEADLRFSPDGKFLFLQDASGVMLLSRNPLRLISYINAAYVYPARFSADSNTLMLVSYDLTFSKWRVSDGARLESRTLPIPEGCLSASLSPTGNFLSCHAPDGNFALYAVASGKKSFSYSLLAPPVREARFIGSDSAKVPVAVRLDRKTAFSAPFGYILANDWSALANRGMLRLPVWFSPDEKFLIASGFSESFRVDLTTFKKENLSSAFQNHDYEVAGILSGGNVLGLDLVKHEAATLPLTAGKPVPLASLSADSLSLSGNSRYALARNLAGQSVRIFDLREKQFVPGVDCVAADVHEDVIAALTPGRILRFFHVNQATPFLSAHLSLVTLPPLRAAAVSPSLDTLAFAFGSASGTFQLPGGAALPGKDSFDGAIFSSAGDLIFLAAKGRKPSQFLTRFDTTRGMSSTPWTPKENADLHASERAFIEYSYLSEMNHLIKINSGSSDVPYRLRGLDPQTGAQLWEQSFHFEVPIPFADPQGDRFVLAWKAKSDGGKTALKALKDRCEVCKNAKITDQDTVFEVRDSRTGKTLGSALAQTGSGPTSFSSALSTGGVLFAVKDGIRVSVFSIETGAPVGHLTGINPAANAQSNLFALNEGSGRLGIFDLSTSARLEEPQFLDEIAYAHFSSDGKRLLVLTQHQEVFILDMSAVREHSRLPQDQNPAPLDQPVNQPQ